ncbi:MAG: thioredoxin domain-containing protein [Deltaproteobacteria bacterium]|nr:thioredoxin domain-containing protein [Deltaproteobacteria bacterium]
MTVSSNSPNKLIKEKSPYLLQHAYNPVDWHAWNEEAFEKAGAENKPIFLSIGYSTCHWCHVMEKESFEDAEVAELMNEAFVSIKVDREERPDIDHVYMTVCQMMTGSGGWPLTIVMTPDKKPFFAATYIPKGSRFGRTGLMELIPRISEVWRNRHKDVLESAENMTAALQSMEKEKPGELLDAGVFDKAFEDLSQRFDKTYGGFSGAPKFPTPHNFFFMLRYWRRTDHQEALKMVEKTLQEIRWGGIFDQVGFGFHRYSTDKEWLVPHFEKMIYDQAMLALAYLETFQATGNTVYSDTAREIFAYVLRDLRSPEGGFYSAEDADSEGVEGKFYVWTEQELRETLPPDEADLIVRVFHVEKNGNFREEASGENLGANILYTGKSLSDIASEMNLPEKELKKKIDSARSRLFEARERRIHPHKDDKILTDWNGLMVAALARGAQVLGDRAYSDAAEGAVEFILKKLRTPDGRLLHRFREGEARIPAHLDDYAFLVWGLLETYEATFDARFLKTALELNKDMIHHFWDAQGGGLYFTSDDAENLIVRKKEVYDGALPSGNAVAMLNLLRLGRFTGDADLEDRAFKLQRAFSEQVRQFPSGYTQFLSAVDFSLSSSHDVVISGTLGAKEMLDALRSRFSPNQVLLFRPAGEESAGIDALAAFAKNYDPVNGKATAYVCSGRACKDPTTEVKDLLALLGQKNP